MWLSHFRKSSSRSGQVCLNISWTFEIELVLEIEGALENEGALEIVSEFLKCVSAAVKGSRLGSPISGPIK